MFYYMVTLYYTNKNFKKFLKKIYFKSPQVNVLTSLLQSIHINSNIFLEKKRRYFIYNSLDYILENYTYFDLITNETFDKLKYIKYITYFLNKSTINISFFKLFCLSTNKSNIKINFNNIIKSKNIKNLILLKLLNISYSNPIKTLLELALNDSLKFYKTPIISFENLILNLCNKYPNFVNLTYLYLLRYKLLKCLHKQENIIHLYIKKNNHFFFYLLNKNSTNLLKTISLKKLNTVINIYRNNLVSYYLKLNLNIILKNEYYLYLLKKYTF